MGSARPYLPRAYAGRPPQRTPGGQRPTPAPPWDEGVVRWRSSGRRRKNATTSLPSRRAGDDQAARRQPRQAPALAPAEQPGDAHMVSPYEATMSAAISWRRRAEVGSERYRLARISSGPRPRSVSALRAAPAPGRWQRGEPVLVKTGEAGADKEHQNVNKIQEGTS